MNKNENKGKEIGDDTISIQDLRQLTSVFVNERNWKRFHTPRALAEAISIESAELLENFLFKTDAEALVDVNKITDEMADIFIYLMSLCNTLDLKSFSQHVFDKMTRNKIKYPVNKFAGENYKKQ